MIAISMSEIFSLFVRHSAQLSVITGAARSAPPKFHAPFAPILGLASVSLSLSLTELEPLFNLLDGRRERNSKSALCLKLGARRLKPPLSLPPHEVKYRANERER